MGRLNMLSSKQASKMFSIQIAFPKPRALRNGGLHWGKKILATHGPFGSMQIRSLKANCGVGGGGGADSKSELAERSPSPPGLKVLVSSDHPTATVGLKKEVTAL